MRGIARDLSAAGLGQLKPIDATPVPGQFTSPISVTLDFPDDQSAPARCSSAGYPGRQERPQPALAAGPADAIGLRPISALVDITNLLSPSIVGRPLHVFDAGKLQGGLTVRLARAGETLMALNGKDIHARSRHDRDRRRHRRVSMGGVMGGESTGCHRDDDRRVP